MILLTQPIPQMFIGEISEKTGEEVIACSDMTQAAPYLPEAEIIVGINGLNGEVLKSCSNLKWIYSLSAGVEKLPFQELSERDILVSNAGGIHGTQIAEQTIGMMILFSRKMIKALKYQQQKIWSRDLPVDELFGRNLCIVGAGKIGIELARKAKAFDMTVTGIKRTPSPLEYFDEVFGNDLLHQALGKADYVVLLTPLTKETLHFFGKEEFAVMKRTSVFINMSRGDTVDEGALIEVLKSGRIGGAGLDVFHNEPLEVSSPLWRMDNVVITPHNAGNTPHYLKRALDLFFKSYECYRSGKPLPTAVDVTRQY